MRRSSDSHAMLCGLMWASGLRLPAARAVPATLLPRHSSSLFACTPRPRSRSCLASPLSNSSTLTLLLAMASAGGVCPSASRAVSDAPCDMSTAATSALPSAHTKAQSVRAEGKMPKKRNSAEG